MSKYFYIIHEDEDARIVTRCGREEFAHEFIKGMEDGNYIIHPSNEDKNHHALQEYIDNKLKGIPAITPKQEGEFKMDKTKMANGLMLIANGFALMSQAFGVAAGTPTEAVKEEAPKEEKAKRTRSTKPREVVEEVKAEEVAEEITTQEDDFGDFDFDGEEEKKTYTIEEVRAACVSHAKKNTKEKTYAILKEFGAKSPNDLKKEQYGDVLAKLAV